MEIKKRLKNRHAIKNLSLPRIKSQLEVATEPDIIKSLTKEKRQLERELLEDEKWIKKNK